MKYSELEERLLSAWIGIHGILKSSRVTERMTYNEAVVMKLVYDQYKRDGVGGTAVSRIVEESHMLKSLVNRTINSLCAQGYLCRERDPEDARRLTVYPNMDRLPDFLAVHSQSLELAQTIINLIGPEDADRFVRMYEKLSASNLRL